LAPFVSTNINISTTIDACQVVMQGSGRWGV
jgi:hypothetical protein